jgi:hypothetical protein
MDTTRTLDQAADAVGDLGPLRVAHVGAFVEQPPERWHMSGQVEIGLRIGAAEDLAAIVERIFDAHLAAWLACERVRQRGGDALVPAPHRGM